MFWIFTERIKSMKAQTRAAPAPGIWSSHKVQQKELNILVASTECRAKFNLRYTSIGLNSHDVTVGSINYYTHVSISIKKPEYVTEILKRKKTKISFFFLNPELILYITVRCIELKIYWHIEIKNLKIYHALVKWLFNKKSYIFMFDCLGCQTT